MTRFVTCITFLALLPFSFSSQDQNSTPAHHHAQASVIDGATHPELIPDLTAYRLYFVTVSKPPDATNDETKHQAAQLAKIGLKEADRKTLIVILSTFNAQYRSLVKAYNEEATAANGEGADIGSFQLQRDQIVQSTHDTLKARLSAGGWALLDSHVQGEKKNMTLGVKEAGQ